MFQKNEDRTILQLDGCLNQEEQCTQLLYFSTYFRWLNHVLKLQSDTVRDNEGVILSGVTGGVAGGRDFIPLHYVRSSRQEPNRNDLHFRVFDNTANTIILKYNNGNDFIIPFTYVDNSNFMNYELQFNDTRLYDSFISFNWLQEYLTNNNDRDTWALDTVSLYLKYGTYHRVIFEDTFDNTESSRTWSLINGPITNTSVCNNPPCVFFNQGPTGTPAQRYAQTPSLDTRVVTYIDIPMSPTLHSTTDCTLEQLPM